MLKFILQLAVALSGFFALMFILGWLMPIFTNPIVFVVIVGLIGLFAVKIAVRS
jgi:hypothetical protein